MQKIIPGSHLQRYLFLDGLRALAMLCVMFDHSYDFYSRYVPNYANEHISSIYAFFGGFANEGVFMFFMISGFLITGVMIRDFSHDIDIPRFYIRRFLKIVPLFTIVIALVYLLSKLLGVYKEYSDVLYLTPLFYLQDFFPAHPIFSHAWSLTVEVEFYLIYPLIALAIFGWIKTPQARRLTLLGSVLFLALLSLCYRHGHGGETIILFQNCDGLFLGCALKLLEPNYLKIKMPYQLIFSTFCFIGAFLVLKTYTTMIEGKLAFRCWDHALPTYAIFTLLFLSAYYGFVPLKWLLENPPIRWLGRISYAFYLWHYPLRYILLKLGPHPYYGFFSSLTCYWIVTIIVAALSTYTIERYFLNLRFKFAPEN